MSWAWSDNLSGYYRVTDIAHHLTHLGCPEGYKITARLLHHLKAQWVSSRNSPLLGVHNKTVGTEVFARQQYPEIRTVQHKRELHGGSAAAAGAGSTCLWLHQKLFTPHIALLVMVTSLPHSKLGKKTSTLTPKTNTEPHPSTPPPPQWYSSQQTTK